MGLVTAVMLLLLLGQHSAGSGEITTPPANGRIVFEGWGCLGVTCSQGSNPAYDIWSVEPDGSGLMNLTPGPGADGDAEWSPDGRTIVFDSDRGGDADIFLMDPDGSNVRRLTSAAGNEWYPAWSPDGSRIVYATDGRRRQDVMVMRADGSRKRVIASFSPRFWVWAFEWSPTGRWIALTKGPASLSAPERYRTYLIRPDGSRFHRLTPRKMWAGFPSWSPDGRRVVFSGGSCGPHLCGSSYIWIISREGGRARRVLQEEAFQYRPEWSPDGTQIVYTSHGNDPFWGGDLWVVDVDGSNNRELLAKPDTWDWGAAWQPLPADN